MASGNPNTDGEAGPASPTGLLPLNAFGGKTPEVGKVCKFRVVQVYGDQAEVEYVSSDDEGYEREEQSALEAPPQDEMTELLS